MSSTCSAALADSALALSGPDTAPLHSASPSRSVANGSLSNGPACLASTMCERSAPMQSDLFNSSAAASPVKISVQPAKAPASTVSAPGCGPRCTGSCASCDPIGCLLKTSLLSELAALTGCSATWKRQATPAGRSWWVLMTSGRPTDASEFGLWPTATATEYGSNQGGASGRVGKIRPSLRGAALWPTATVRMWSTPMAHDARRPSLDLRSTNGSNLSRDVAMWPSPHANCMNGAGHTQAKQGAPNLQTAALWPTPNASDDKNLGEANPGHSPTLHQLPGPLAAGSHSTSGSRRESSPVLNSSWVAALMGYPRAWAVLTTECALRLWATRSSRKSPKSSEGQS